MSRPNASRDQLIYEQYAADGITMREIAAAYGVTTQRISKIIASVERGALMPRQ